MLPSEWYLIENNTALPKGPVNPNTCTLKPRVRCPTSDDVMSDPVILMVLPPVSTVTSVTWSEMMGHVSVVELTFLY